MVTVAQYLAHRLHALGARHLFGVPGDFSLSLLDSVLETDLLEWVGSPNELNAGYAADAYARTRGIGALVTTFGVGELSAIDAVAGAYAEHVPLVQITGAPATGRDGLLLHHTLGDGDLGHFARAYGEVTAAGAVLTHADAVEQIDAVLATAVRELRPVYLAIPADVAVAPVDPARLGVPLPMPAPDEVAVAGFRAAARALLRGAHSAVVIAGHLVERTRRRSTFRALVDAADSPVVTLTSGRGAIDSDHPLFAGVYVGEIGAKRAVLAVETADVLLEVGTLMTDAVTGMFTHRDDPGHTVHLGVETARVAGREFPVPFATGLAVLTELLAELDGALHRDLPDLPATGPVAGEALDQEALWATVERRLPAGARLVTDIGTTFWGAAGITLPAGVDVVAQPVWSSIGYALPATLGCALAAPKRRPVLVVGDGAAQMTVQELGNLARHANPVVVIVDNSGYTIERALQSPQAVYNDVAAWDWTLLARAFAPGVDLRTATPTSAAELDAELAAALDDDRMTLLHVRLDALDVPAGLRGLADRHHGR